MNKEDFKLFMLTWLGIPYIYGGSSNQGIDCSGLVQELLAPLGLDPPGDQNAEALYHWALNQKHTNDLKPGALVFFGGEAHVSHIAMIFTGDIMIEAGGGDHTTLTLSDAVKRNAFTRLRPISRRKDIVATIYLQAVEDRFNGK